MDEMLHFPDNTNCDVKSFLIGIYGLYSKVFPDQIVSYYITGSRAVNQNIDSSDFDLAFVIKDSKDPLKHITNEQFTEAYKLTKQIRSISRYPVDITILGEQNIKYGGVLACIKQRFLVTGTDVLTDTPLISGVKLQLIHSKVVLHNMRILRDSEVLFYPLDYPDSKDRYCGYTKHGQWSAGDTFQEGLNTLVCLVTIIATLRLSIYANILSPSKQYTFENYRKLLPNDKWVDLIEDIFQICRIDCKGKVPDSPAIRFKIETVCKEVLNMENDFINMLLTDTSFWIDPNDSYPDTKQLVKYVLSSIKPFAEPYKSLHHQLYLKYVQI